MINLFQNIKFQKTFHLIWAFLCCLYFPKLISYSQDTLRLTNSILTVVMLFAIYYLLEHAKFTSKRLTVLTHILAFIYTVFIILGNQLDSYYKTNLRLVPVTAILYTHVIAALLSLLWSWLEDAERKLSAKNSSESRFRKVVNWLCNRPYIITLILFVCWLPCFLSDFPGGFRHDAYSELNQATINLYNPAFPALHSVIITRFLPFIYNLTGSYNAGIAIYTVIQMILIAILYTYIIISFKKRNINDLILSIVFIYMALFPTIHMLVEFNGRDMLFSGLLIYTVFLVYEMITDKEYFFKNLLRPITLALVLPLTVYARNNNSGPVLLIGMIVITGLIIIFNFKSHRKYVLTFGIVCIGFYILLSAILPNMCQPSRLVKPRESMAFFAQTLSRAYVLENDSWTQDELDELCKFADPEIIARYFPVSADEPKSSLFIDENNKKDFLKFWWKIGKKHPGCYLDAYLMLSQPMWYPDSVLYGYTKARNEGYYGREKQYFSIAPEMMEQPAEHINILPAVNKFYQMVGLDISFEKIPVLSMLFSIGFHFWFILNALLYLIYRKQNKLLLPVLFIFIYMAICSFVPIVLVRYFAAAFFTAPLFFVFVLEPKKANEPRN